DLYVSALVQLGEPAKDIGRAVILADDVLAYLAQLCQIDVIAAQHLVRGLGVPEDRRQRLVELVRYGGGELPDRGDARHVAQGGTVLGASQVGGFPLGDVERDPEQAPRVALLGPPARGYPAHRPIGIDDAVFDVELFVGRERPAYGPLEGFAVGGM